MQKKVIALAVAGLISGAAFAQTSVVLSGNIDLGYSARDWSAKTPTTKYRSDKTGFLGNGGTNWTSSELRLAVTEDLGNGLKAGFFQAMELNGVSTGSNTTTAVWGEGVDGAQTALGNIRDAYVFLNSASMGQVAVGYKYTLENQISAIGNPGTNNGRLGRAFATKLQAGSATMTGTTEGGVIDLVDRANVFEYASPVFGGGFKVMAQYGQTDINAYSKAISTGVKTITTDNESTFWALGGTYANGPLSLGAYYSDLTNNVSSGAGVAGERNDRNSWGLFGSYDFQVAKVFASYVDRNIDRKSISAASVVTANNKIDYNGFDLGVKVPFAGKFTFTGSYGWGDASFKDTGASSTDTRTANYDVRAYTLALTYDFSKRTSVTAYYMDTSYDGGKRAAGSSYDGDVLGFGLRHQF